MPSQKDLEKAYGQGKADAEAGRPDRSQKDSWAEIIGAITGLNQLPPDTTETDNAYRAGYKDGQNTRKKWARWSMFPYSLTSSERRSQTLLALSSTCAIVRVGGFPRCWHARLRRPRSV